VAVSSGSFGRSTRCSFVNLMATATKSDINQACHSSVSKRSFEDSFWRRIIAGPASPQGQFPRNDGRKAGSCLACPSRSSSLTSCLCRKYALAGASRWHSFPRSAISLARPGRVRGRRCDYPI
jgi:hypothetical protein